jgi:hypothetical protein
MSIQRIKSGVIADNAVTSEKFASSLTLPANVAVTNGIAFPATQSASANANTLDDYEEGTFTPTISGSGSAGVGTYTVRDGAYTKVGNLVFFRWSTRITGHTGTGNFVLTGLPFTPAGSSTIYYGITQFTYALSLSAGNLVTVFIAANSTSIVFEQIATGGGLTTAVPLDTACEIYISGTYMTA